MGLLPVVSGGRPRGACHLHSAKENERPGVTRREGGRARVGPPVVKVVPGRRCERIGPRVQAALGETEVG